jgi:hypothetical protein
MVPALSVLAATLLLSSATCPEDKVAPAADAVLLKGKVLAPDGKPAKDTWVSAARQAPEGEVPSTEGAHYASFTCMVDCVADLVALMKKQADVSSISTCTRKDGSFELVVPRAGGYSLLVQPASFPSQLVEVTAPKTDVAVQLEAGVTVSGRVADSKSRPAKGIQLSLNPPVADSRFLTRTRSAASGKDASFKFTGVGSGNHSIMATRPGKPKHKGDDPPAPTQTDFAVPGASVTVKVLAPDP